MCRSPRQWIAAALVLVAMWAVPSWAENDTFGLGTGRDGELTVSTTGVVVNSYAQVIDPLVPGDTVIHVRAASGFEAGRLILVHQTTGLVPVPSSGSSTNITLNTTTSSSVGLWELARISGVSSDASGLNLTLSKPLVNSYASSVSQVVAVPEYTSVRIESTGSIVASPWNGSVGGFVAFLVQGTLSSDGLISAKGAGFRGGAYVKDSSGTKGCSGLDETAPKGAQKGEGITLSYGPTSTGRGNMSTGGGGGVCFKAGGGGGSNGRKGGQGGYSHSSLDGARDVGGLGGTDVSYIPLERFIFGGGGGAGHGTDGTGGGGGNGGGIVFIRANKMIPNKGTILANGEDAKVLYSLTDAGSGGGAGGVIYLRTVDISSCASLDASGGGGGITNAGSSYVGPGGGGSGGYIVFQSTPSASTCPASVALGLSGNKQDSSTTPYPKNYGATIGIGGVLYPSPPYNYGFIIPAVPTVLNPKDGQWFRSRYVEFETTAPTTVIVKSDKVFSFVDGVQGNPLNKASTGTFQGSVGPLSEGPHVFEFAGFVDYAWSQRTAPVTVYVDTIAPDAPVVSAPNAGSWLNNRTPTLSGTAEASSTVHVFIDGNEAGTADASAAGAWSFAPTTPLVDGEHRAKAQAVDRAGNASTDSVVRVFNVDATAPVTRIDVSPPAQTDQTSATFRFSADDTTATFQCRLDSAAFAVCESPYNLSALSKTGHTLEIRAQDLVGNVESPPVRYTWTITSGTPDAGTNPGTPDAGTNPGTPDAGSDPGTGGEPKGCGCSAPGLDPSMTVMALAGLAAFVSRRRRK